MKHTLFETVHGQAKDSAVQPDYPKISGIKTENLGSDAERKTLDNGSIAVETVAWMKLLGLIR